MINHPSQQRCRDVSLQPRFLERLGSGWWYRYQAKIMPADAESSSASQVVSFAVHCPHGVCPRCRAATWHKPFTPCVQAHTTNRNGNAAMAPRGKLLHGHAQASPLPHHLTCKSLGRSLLEHHSVSSARSLSVRIIPSTARGSAGAAGVPASFGPSLSCKLPICADTMSIAALREQEGRRRAAVGSAL